MAKKREPINKFWRLYYVPKSELEPSVLGQNLKSIRLELGMSRRELAEKSGVSQESIQWIEDYGREPRLSQIDNLLKAMGYQMIIGKARRNQ